MKNKLILVLGLSSLLMFGACKGSQTNTNTNTNAVVVATPTPVAKTTETAATDPNLKSKIETALKAKGFTDVTVDTAAPKMVVRGTVAKGKLPEVVKVVMEANGGKPVDNQVTEK